MIFYKGVLVSDLKSNYIPGTVTRSFQEALTWKERIESRKTKGAARHSRKGKAVVIEIDYEDALADPEHFQQADCTEHQRPNCWLAHDHVKAQINTPVTFRILSEDELDDRLFQQLTF
jgi:hypothetical protein